MAESHVVSALRLVCLRHDTAVIFLNRRNLTFKCSATPGSLKASRDRIRDNLPVTTAVLLRVS
jgi:hypothetical protein